MSPDSPAPVAVVTGAGRGIGAAVARALAGEGWRLVLCDACADNPAADYPLSTRRELDAVAAECGAEALTADVRSQAEMDSVVTRAVELHGGLDAAVAAAGLMVGGRQAWETEDDGWAALMGVNAEGVWRLARAAVPALLGRPEPRRGRFVAISSVAGLRGMPLLAAYSASKHAVIGLVRSMAAELGPTGVTANVICPGSTRTHMLGASAEIYGLESPEEFAVHHPTGRLLHPEEPAAAVRFLLSREASGLTGAVIPVDSGMSAAQ